MASRAVGVAADSPRPLHLHTMVPMSPSGCAGSESTPKGGHSGCPAAFLPDLPSAEQQYDRLRGWAGTASPP